MPSTTLHITAFYIQAFMEGAKINMDNLFTVKTGAFTCPCAWITSNQCDALNWLDKTFSATQVCWISVFHRTQLDKNLGRRQIRVRNALNTKYVSPLNTTRIMNNRYVYKQMQTGKAENYTQINNAESQRYRTKFFEGSIPSFTSKHR